MFALARPGNGQSFASSKATAGLRAQPSSLSCFGIPILLYFDAIYLRYALVYGITKSKRAVNLLIVSKLTAL